MATLIEGRREEYPLMLTAGVLEAFERGVICGVGRGPKWTKGGGRRSTELNWRGAGSRTRGIACGLIGNVASDGAIGLSDSPVILCEAKGQIFDENFDARVDGVMNPASTSLSSGVSLGMIDRQSSIFSVGDGKDVGEGGGCVDGVYRNTMSVHRWKTVSDMCSRQLTAMRKVISFMLISTVFKPDILLQARAE